jgi:hypothetical protein
MPTPESAEAFAELDAARTRLNDVTKQLNEAHARLANGGQAARLLHASLQKEWDEAFRAFTKATDDFSAIVHEMHRPDSR